MADNKDSTPSVPEGCNATVIAEVSQYCKVEQVYSFVSWARDIIGETYLMRFESTVSPVKTHYAARVTIIIHSAKQRRHHMDVLFLKNRTIRRKDLEIANILDKELERNTQISAVIEQDVNTLNTLVEDYHLLWCDITNSTNSAIEVIEDLCPRIKRVTDHNDISSLMLFIEVDRDFTSMGDIERIRTALAAFIPNDATVIINIRLIDSRVKYITCRAVLVGNPPYILGDVYERFDQYEIVLYSDDNKDRGYEIIASYDTDNEFCLSRYDWGVEGNLRGISDDHHYFDVENTKKLFAALHVKTPTALLRTIRRRFANRFPSMADSELLGFCRKKGIKYLSDYHY